jgi:hypothetical protein
MLRRIFRAEKERANANRCNQAGGILLRDHKRPEQAS